MQPNSPSKKSKMFCTVYNFRNLYFRRSHIPKFYEITKNGTDGCLYYGFATCGNKVFDSFSNLLEQKKENIF